jgi:hypothetical protein
MLVYHRRRRRHQCLPWQGLDPYMGPWQTSMATFITALVLSVLVLRPFNIKDSHETLGRYPVSPNSQLVSVLMGRNKSRDHTQGK